jgi:glycerol-3-phosphate acyltransferase PlsY
VNESLPYALWAIGAYLLGSVSLGDLVARAAGKEIRGLGTGNPGTANTFRELGVPYAITVFMLDLAKGAAATVLLLPLDAPAWAGFLAGLAVVAGHIFPVFWGFRGGTGLVVGMGATAGLLPLGAVVAIPFIAATAVFTRNMGHAGAAFFAAAIVAGWLVHGDALGVAAVLLIGLAVFVKSRLQYGHWTLGRRGRARGR